MSADHWADSFVALGLVVATWVCVVGVALAIAIASLASAISYVGCQISPESARCIAIRAAQA